MLEQRLEVTELPWQPAMASRWFELLNSQRGVAFLLPALPVPALVVCLSFSAIRISVNRAMVGAPASSFCDWYQPFAEQDATT